MAKWSLTDVSKDNEIKSERNAKYYSQSEKQGTNTKDTINDCLIWNGRRKHLVILARD